MKNTVTKRIAKYGKQLFAVTMVMMMAFMTFAPYQLGYAIAADEQSVSEQQSGQQPAPLVNDENKENDANVEETAAAMPSNEEGSDSNAAVKNFDDANDKSINSSSDNEKADNEKSESKKEVKSEKKDNKLVCKDTSYTVSVAYDEKAKLSDDTKLKVKSYK